MLILGRDRAKDPTLGFAKTFLRQMEESLGLAAERGVKIVTNAGGLNPAGLAERLRTLAASLGVDVNIAHVEGDDLRPRAAQLGFDGALTANAYLGGWGIVACLERGADVVVTGRVTDASLVVGPAAAHFGWSPRRLRRPGRRDRRRSCRRVRRPGDRRQLLVLHRARRPSPRRLPDRRGARRRVERHHQAPRAPAGR